MPSLQFTLYDLAERSPHRSLTLEAYHRLGGVSGAIASRAESLYDSLDGDERSAVRRLFEQLVVVSDGEPLRRRATQTELGTSPLVRSTIERWASARLLTLDRHPRTRMPTVELAHEALLREWPRLRGWIDEDNGGLVVRTRRREAAVGWEELGRDSDALYRGARLEVALEASAELPALEREFLEASRQVRDHERHEADERMKRQARDNRRLRIQRSAIAAGLVAAVAVGVVAAHQRADAVREGHVASARELSAAADAQVDEDPELSMLLALAAVAETRTHDGSVLREAEEALHRAIGASRLVLNVPGAGGDLDWSPTGAVFVSEGPEDSGLVDIRDSTTGRSVLSFRGHAVDVNGVTFSRDGSMLASTGDDGALRVWDATTGHGILEIRSTAETAVVGPSFSPDGTRVAASWPHDDGRVRVIDIASEEVVAELAAEGPWGTSFSPDGRRLAIGQTETTVVVDIASGERVFSIPGTGDLPTVDWSPDGRWLAMPGEDATAKVVRADTGVHHATITGHTATVYDVEWSADSTRLATVGDDGIALVTEVDDDGARDLVALSVQESAGGLFGASFSPDGDRLITGDLAVTAAKVWDISATGGAEWASHADVDWSGVALTPDGRSLVVAGARGQATLVDLETGDRVADYAFDPSGNGSFGRIELSRDGTALAGSVQPGGWVRVLDVTTGELRSERSYEGEVRDLSWSPAADLLGVVVADGGREHAVILDSEGTELTRVSEARGQIITSATFSADGGLLAVTREGEERTDLSSMPVTIWDWRSGDVVRTIDTAAAFAVFDPTGTRLASARRVEGIVDLWDAETGAVLSTLTAGSRAGAIAFGQDGSVVTGHADGTVRLWNAHTGVQLLRLDASTRLIRALQLSADGSRLLVVDDNGLARVMALDIDDLILIAKDRLTRTLTEAECRQFLHSERCPDL